jgi:hypothetical protein
LGRTEIKLSEALLSFANWNARKAFEQFQDNDTNVRLNAAACAGMAAELLLKHLLAQQSPSLLAELTASAKSRALAARMTFSTDDYSLALADVRSCTAEDAFFTHDRLEAIPTAIAIDEFNVLMQVRNAACHLAALTSRAKINEAIYALISMYEKAQSELPNLESPFSGIEPRIEVFQHQYRQSSFKAVTAKIKEHKEHFHSKQVPANVDDPKNFLELWSAMIFDEDYSFAGPEVKPHKCTACGSPDGSLLCEVVPETFYRPDVPGQNPTEWVQGKRLHPMAFACEKCNLSLSPSELRTLETNSDGWALHAMKSIVRHSESFEIIPDGIQVSPLSE